MKTALVLLAVLGVGASTLMPTAISDNEPDAGVFDAVDMSPAQAIAAREAAMAEAEARVSQGADLRQVYAELRIELARLDAIISGLQREQ